MDYIAKFNKVASSPEMQARFKKVDENVQKQEIKLVMRRCTGKNLDIPTILANWKDTCRLEQKIIDQLRSIGLQPRANDAPLTRIHLPGHPEMEIVVINEAKLSTNGDPEPEIPTNQDLEPEIPTNGYPEPEIPTNGDPEPEIPTNGDPESESLRKQVKRRKLDSWKKKGGKH
ncbi:uncharacterized protein LOC108040498 [Drosophila rhopaloa]|uniref:Uncharacterized protein LOC108040498 n=1 Tax=Drosophila rhopaloa TaxID=1041015 RepID=A0A6P4EEM5_DRORH|nr:uncharacterized protein LOC108040498 [Drosophila rhopaloa]